MFRSSAMLGAAVALGLFGATLTRHLRLVPPDEVALAALSGLAPFAAGLVWLGVGLTLVLQRPRERPVQALYLAGLAGAVSLFCRAGGAEVLGGGFALCRDAASWLAALGLAGVAALVGEVPARLAVAVLALGAAGGAFLPGPAAWTPPAAAALMLALRGRARGLDFTARQQSTWLSAGLGVTLAAALGAGLAATSWLTDLATLLSVCAPLAAALSLQKVRLLDAGRLVGTLAVGAALFLLALGGTLAVYGALSPLPEARRTLLSGVVALLLLAVAAALRQPLTSDLRDRLLPARARLRRALEAATEALWSVPLAEWGPAIAARLGRELGGAPVRIWRVEPGGRLRRLDDPAAPGVPRLRVGGRLWTLCTVFGAPLAASDLEGVPLEPAEAAWLEGGVLLVPLIFDDRPAGFVQVGAGSGAAPPLDATRRALARFMDEATRPFALAAARDAREAEVAAARRLEGLAQGLRRARDARLVQRAVQGLAGHLRRLAHDPNAVPGDPVATESGRQLGVCDMLLGQVEDWHQPPERRLVPLAPIVDEALLAVAPELRELRLDVELPSELDLHLVYTDAGALAVLLAERLQEALRALRGFSGPRALRLSAAPRPDAPGFLEVCLWDTAPEHGSEPEDRHAALVRALGARRTRHAGPEGRGRGLELPMTG